MGGVCNSYFLLPRSEFEVVLVDRDCKEYQVQSTALVRVSGAPTHHCLSQGGKPTICQPQRVGAWHSLQVDALLLVNTALRVGASGSLVLSLLTHMALMVNKPHQPFFPSELLPSPIFLVPCGVAEAGGLARASHL